MKNLILIKLGGSVITDKKKPFTAKPEAISRFAKEIKAASLDLGQNTLFLTGHGGGSFPHTPATKYQTKNGIINKDSLIGAVLVEDAARQLNMILIKNFLSQDLPVITFSPSSFLISDAQVCSKSYLEPLKKALEIGMIPVVYGDLVMDVKTGFTIFSTEIIFSELAKELKEEYEIRIIYVTNVGGVYDENGRTIPEISNNNFETVRSSIIGSKGIDVTGGMIHKVEEALKLVKMTGIETTIINGNMRGDLKKAILGVKIVSTKVKN